MAKRYICDCGKIQTKREMKNELYNGNDLYCNRNQCTKMIFHGDFCNCKVYRIPSNIFLDILAWTPLGIYLAFDKMDADLVGGMWSFMNGAVIVAQIILILILLGNFLN